MAISFSDTKFQERFKLVASANWQPVDVFPVGDPKVTDFSPPGTDLKPVLYIPVKRRGGADTFPQLRIHVKLLEAELRTRNFDIPKLVGAEVKFDLANFFAPFSGNSFHISLPSSHLDSELKCDVTISAADVKKFLDPDGPMKARLNENLLQFVVEISAVQVDGLPLQGISENRVYLYRKKSIVFLPGVFGTQFQVDQSEPGKKKQADAFPNFLEDDALARIMDSGVLSILKSTVNQRVGVLECDNQGDPILPAFKPKLLRFGGFVYDTFTKLHDARHRKLTPVPDDFLVYDLRLFAYDWRLDLTQCAKEMMDRLRQLQGELRSREDTDDQVAVAGHSTGGVIIRKMLGEPGAESLVSHAFFLNVPFRGAPKALGVILTGCDPPDGNFSHRMIPFIQPKSLVYLCPCAPIVYHLAPSFAFPTPVAEIPGGIPPFDPNKNLPAEIREREKVALIIAAEDRDIYFARGLASIPPNALSSVRPELASGADAWSKLLDDFNIHRRGQAAYDKLGGAPAQKFNDFLDDEAQSRGLGFQRFRRSGFDTGGLVPSFLDRAKAFHKSSEEIAKSGKWKDKAFIFYSKGHDTTMRVVIKSEGSQDCQNNVVALIRPSNTIDDLTSGRAHPPEPSGSDGVLHVEQWDGSNGLFKRFWSVSRVTGDGDGTVPLPSLLGFGGPAKVFKALPGNPEHVPAPNSDFLWDRVMELLEGFDVSSFFQNADTTQGLEL
jgi:lecithin:cholesterol acyltransferase